MENLMARIAILQVVSTSRHITQGVIDMLEERWDDGKNVLSGRSLVVGGDPYELRIAIPEGGAWKVGDVVAQGANIKVAGVDKRGPRVLIESAQSREVRWKIGWCGGGKVGKN